MFHCDHARPEHIELPGADLLFWPQFYTPIEAQHLYSHLMQRIAWEEKTIIMYGREVLVPRLSAWYADTHKDYTYSGHTHAPLPWIPELSQLKHAIEERSGEVFNSVLCNLYRNGQDSVAWHSDDELELGNEPVIASLSFGEARTFQLRRRDDHQQKFALELSAGSCLLMKGKTQKLWQHQIAKSVKPMEARINLTFRLIS